MKTAIAAVKYFHTELNLFEKFIFTLFAAQVTADIAWAVIH